MARPEWIAYSNEEIEEFIVKFKREGKSASQIGVILRDQYGIEFNQKSSKYQRSLRRKPKRPSW